MNTQQTNNNAQKFEGAKNAIARLQWARVLALVLVLSLGAQQLAATTWRASADGPDMNTVLGLVEGGQGILAVQAVAAEAAARGGWAIAPGDELAYDRFMDRQVRGASVDFDEAPNCSNPKITFDQQACLENFRAMERAVLFGPSFFTTPQPDGSVLPRPAFDDLLSTFVEEASHSWQEYLYETNGVGTGARTHETTLAESKRWSRGREYQVKMYILNLDGKLLQLSDMQRSTLKAQICGDYANPMGHEVPSYNAPAGWPHPEGWPTAAPAQVEFDAFCAA